MYYVKRPYRKNLTSHGLIYMGGETREITVRNLSITGALAELNCRQGYESAEAIYEVISASTMIDVRFPEMCLVGDAEIVRVDMDDEHTFIAMEFKRICHDVDDQLYKKNFYSKYMAAPGRIRLNDEYLEFTTVNVSADGLMIRLSEAIAVEAGMIAQFEFEQLELEGEVQVLSVDAADAGIVIGLKYLYIVNTAVNGAPFLI
ncbi:MAG: PilZ domain-containing protein [Methylobacter sp.]|uniref:PilZ domain-containing protein n=1 Tax=Methylobacter sp. TaxID=2051955 RepID=UPI0025862716|nr:PilZ domain-containing protein [Methylobacter sp.]MCL7422170.1 PilZ domain-containing protein [Methylobacter sp.]